MLETGQEALQEEQEEQVGQVTLQRKPSPRAQVLKSTAASPPWELQPVDQLSRQPSITQSSDTGSFLKKPGAEVEPTGLINDERYVPHDTYATEETPWTPNYPPSTPTELVDYDILASLVLRALTSW